jgi:hypothetical protein
LGEDLLFESLCDEVTAGTLGQGVPSDQAPESIRVRRRPQVGELVHQYVVADPSRHLGDTFGDADRPIFRCTGAEPASGVWDVPDRPPSQPALEEPLVERLRSAFELPAGVQPLQPLSLREADDHAMDPRTLLGQGEPGWQEDHHLGASAFGRDRLSAARAPDDLDLHLDSDCRGAGQQRQNPRSGGVEPVLGLAGSGSPPVGGSVLDVHAGDGLRQGAENSLHLHQLDQIARDPNLPGHERGRAAQLVLGEGNRGVVIL